jgi:hypothetical protein
MWRQVMNIPRVGIVVPLLLLGTILPALGDVPAPPPPGAVGMAHETFARKRVVVRCGEPLKMVNNSRWVHIIGPGNDGVLKPDPGVPMMKRQLLETNAVFTTPPWVTPGVHRLACAVHPEMNVDVIVTSCSARASG